MPDRSNWTAIVDHQRLASRLRSVDLDRACWRSALRRRTLARPGAWTGVAAKALAVILVGEQVSWQLQFLIHHDWSRFNSLPFDLCDFTCFVAAVACWTQLPLFVELTWFWALAGTLQAVITPDQYTPFPYLSFDNYVIEHLGIIVAALYLVVGLRLSRAPGRSRGSSSSASPMPGLCAILDAATGGDYLYLRRPPPRPASSTCSVPGPGTSCPPRGLLWRSSCCSACPSGPVIRVTLGKSTPEGSRPSASDPSQSR